MKVEFICKDRENIPPVMEVLMSIMYFSSLQPFVTVKPLKDIMIELEGKGNPAEAFICKIDGERISTISQLVKLLDKKALWNLTQ